MSTHKIRNYYKNYYIKQKQKKPHPALVGLQLDAHLCHPSEAQLSEGNNSLLKVVPPTEKKHSITSKESTFLRASIPTATHPQSPQTESTTQVFQLAQYHFPPFPQAPPGYLSVPVPTLLHRNRYLLQSSYVPIFSFCR